MVVCDCWSVGDGEVGGGGAIDVITELLNSTENAENIYFKFTLYKIIVSFNIINQVTYYTCYIHYTVYKRYYIECRDN